MASTIDLVRGFSPPKYVPSERMMESAVHTNMMFVDEVDDEQARKFFVVAVVPLFMCMVGVVLCCLTRCNSTWLCRCKYRRERRPRVLGFRFFCFSAVAAIIASAFVFPGEVKLSDQIDEVHSLGTKLIPIVDTFQKEFNGTLEQVVQINGDVDVLLKCSEDSPIPFSFETELRTAKQVLIKAIQQSNTMVSMFDELSDEGDSALAHSEAWESGRNAGVFTLSSVMLFLIVNLVLMTCLLFKNPGRNTCKNVKTCGGGFFSCLLFILLVIASSFSVMLASFVYGFGHLGSLVCAPDPDQGLQDAVHFITENKYDALTVGECTWNTTNSSLPGPELLQMMCFYQKCEGEFELLKRLQALEESRAKILEALEESGSPPAGSPDTCIAAYSSLRTICDDDLREQIVQVAEEFQCERLNEIYRSMAYDFLCDGVVEFCLDSWKALYAAGLLTLISLFLYSHFDLGTPGEYVYPGSKNDYKFNDETFYNDADAGDIAEALPTQEKENVPLAVEHQQSGEAGEKENPNTIRSSLVML